MFLFKLRQITLGACISFNESTNPLQNPYKSYVKQYVCVSVCAVKSAKPKSLLRTHSLLALQRSRETRLFIGAG